MKTTPLSHPRCRPVFLMKYVLLFIFMISSNLALSQTNFFVTPEGALDKVFDQRGVQYNLSDLMTDKDGSGAITQSYFMDCGSSSIFNLY